MGNLTQDTFKRIMKVLSDMYPHCGLGKDTLTAYYAILHDIPAELLKAATIQYGSEDHDFLPSAGKLRQLAFDLLDTADGRIGPYEAWDEVCKAVGSHGVYRGDPEFEDPAVSKAIAGVGGWRAVCMAPEDAIMSTRARFVEAFKRARAKERKQQRMLPQVRGAARELSGGGPQLPELPEEVDDVSCD